MVLTCRCRQFISPLTYKSVRLCSQKKLSSPGSKYVKPTAGLSHYLVDKYYKFVQGYEGILERSFPRVFRVYRVFSVGAKDLFRDIKEYTRLSQELNLGRNVRNLSRKELETYFQTPKDLTKVAPFLLILALPFANYVLLPLAYLFPRRLLSRQFWSLEQRINFAVYYHTKRLYYYRPVFRYLQAKVESVKDEKLREKCSEMLNKVGSGIHPSVTEILEVKSLFTDEPYGLSELSSSHMKRLCRMHGLNAFMGKRYRLWTHSGFVREMDLAMERDGLNIMNLDELRWACFLRGLSPMGLSRGEMIVWLNQWIAISRNINDHCLSLLLHCPVLLSYNYSSNWVLIH